MGDDATEGKSVQALLLQKDTLAHGEDIYARGQRTVVHRDLDRLEDQGDPGDPASHHAPGDREDQEGQYREVGWGVEAAAVAAGEAGEGAGAGAKVA